MVYLMKLSVIRLSLKRGPQVSVITALFVETLVWQILVKQMSSKKVVVFRGIQVSW